MCPFIDYSARTNFVLISDFISLCFELWSKIVPVCFSKHEQDGDDLIRMNVKKKKYLKLSTVIDSHNTKHNWMNFLTDI